MGAGSFDAASYRSYSASTVGKTTDEVFTKRAFDAKSDKLSPLGVKVRESRDSADNPKSTPIIVALDVTGSMGMCADVIAREGLGTLFTGILDRKPVSDPHVMFMGIGDAAAGDRAPLQISQFEADNRVVEQLADLWLEKGGGGNNFESYHLAWYFAAFHTEHDSIDKRGKRGYLFTVGDEEVPAPLTPPEVLRVCGDTIQAPLSAQDLLELAQRKYDCFHIIIKEGSHARGHLGAVVDGWTNLLGQRVIQLDDHKKLAEVIVSAIEVAEGRNAEDSAKAWGSAGRVVLDAVKSLPRSAGSSAPRLGMS